MSPEEFRRHGHEVVDWIAAYLAHPERYPVLPKLEPGELSGALPRSGPELGEPMETILKDFEDRIVPAITHWNSPGFMGYFATTATGPGILGEMLAATLNPNVEYFYDIENATVGSANLDVTFDIARFGVVSPYLGVGGGLGYVDTDFGGSDTSLLGNAIGGVRFNLAFLKPYAQVKYVHNFDEGGGNDYALTVGLRF